ncbi:hypothetical protein BIY22_07055 [Vibrio panuliri]|uniref:Uncharacterized protein n=1 Tax=Vibrio panuliri TaxID=1381081 RepID=A0A1Q9HDZ4_9VIBR|nr:DUF6708 domain-containing protein [Vibrio panuliri]OLQ87929.1 hypothetical protein BIY22_07055 [Vibrio panuliri]
MSQIKQIGPNHWVGPEDFGFTPNFHITQYGVEHYPNGHLIQQEPLNPGNKKITLINRIKEAEDMGEFFEGFSAGGHEGFIDMRVQSVHGRGENVFAVIFFALLWLVIKTSMVYTAGDTWSPNYLDMIVSAILAICMGLSLFKPIAMPIRFHKQNQEVYVWHNKILYRIPWQECELSVIVAKTHMGYGRLKDGYELMLWLNPKHAANADLTGNRHQYISLLHNMGSHAPVYGYWEYVRRYMTGEQPLWYEISKEPRIAGVNIELAREKGYSNFSALIRFILVMPIIFIFRPADFSLWCNPLRHKWPEQVHEWTGKRCNWH